MARKNSKNFLIFFIFLFISLNFLHSIECRRGNKIIITGGGSGGGSSHHHHGSHNHQTVLPVLIPVPVVQHHPVFIEHKVPIYVHNEHMTDSPQHQYNHYETYEDQMDVHSTYNHQTYNHPTYNHWFTNTYHDK